MSIEDYLVQLRCPTNDPLVLSLMRQIREDIGSLPDDTKAKIFTNVVQLMNRAHLHGGKYVKERVMEALSWPRTEETRGLST